MNNSPFEPDERSTEAVPVTPGALEVMERAQIDLQIATAKRYPRTLSRVKAEMMTFATLDEETASSCFYTIPRGGKVIQGPSVRLAEIAFSCWTNVRAATRILETVTDGPTPHVVVQSMAFDLEKNTSVMMEKRRRITKKKNKGAPDEDDINLAANACAAIAFRDAVLKVVPKALITPVCQAAMRVAVGEVKSLATKRTAVIKRLNQMGITEDRILAAVECAKVDDIGLDQLGTLIGLGTALKDGETTVEEAFPPIAKTQAKPATPGQGEPPDDIPMGSGPATAPQAAPSTGPAGDRQQGPIAKPEHEQLEAVVVGGGFNFDDFRDWASRTGNITDADSLASFEDIPPKVAARILKAKTGLLQALAQGRKEAVA